MAVVSSGVRVQPQARHSDGGVALYLVVLRSSLRSDMCVHSLPTDCGLLTAGFEQCVCQDFTNCRFLMVFLCCQALLQDAGAHGQRASQTLNFGGPLSLLPELFDVLWPFRSCKRICIS